MRINYCLSISGLILFNEHNTLHFKEQILKLFLNYSDQRFNDLSFQVFEYQSKNNKVYNKYLSLINIKPKDISTIDEIPLMPINLYKNQIIKTSDWSAEKVFQSSGTTNSTRSKNYIKSLEWYHQIAKSSFELEFGPLNDYIVLALLPSYIDNRDSSLVSMVDYFIRQSDQEKGGFFQFDFKNLSEYISNLLELTNKKILLIGVSFALIDFCKINSFDNSQLTIMFTGGMKNRGRELTFSELHKTIKTSFPSSIIVSEYGMTELCSQAYSNEFGVFKPAPTMKVLGKEITDPFTTAIVNKNAQIGVIDLGNIDTLSFILTEDAGRQTEVGFEILGRLDLSDIRGCNLLYQSL